MTTCQLINPVVNRWCREAQEHHDDFWLVPLPHCTGSAPGIASSIGTSRPFAGLSAGRPIWPTIASIIMSRGMGWPYSADLCE